MRKGAGEAARRRNPGTTPIDEKGFKNEKAFVNFELGKEQVEALVASARRDPLLLEKTLKIFSDLRYQISLKWEARNSCYVAFIIPLDEADENYGAILTGRGGSYKSALLEAGWKHFAFEGIWEWQNKTKMKALWDADL